MNISIYPFGVKSLNIQLETKKILPLSATFIVLIISLSFLESEWKILYRLKAEILNFFMVWKFFLYFEDILSYQFWYKNHTFFSQIQKYHFSNSDQKNFSVVKTSIFIDYFAVKFSKINAFNKNNLFIWTIFCFHSIKTCYFLWK